MKKILFNIINGGLILSLLFSSNFYLLVNVIYSPNIVKSVSAQESNDPSEDLKLDQNYFKWAATMRAFGVYPQPEGDDIILYDQETYLEKFCQNNCILNQPSSQAIIASSRDNLELITGLRGELNGLCYDVDAILSEYFPETSDLNLLPRVLPRPGYCATQGISDTIDEETLSKLIRDYYTKLGILAGELKEEFKDPITSLITVTDPIFSTRAISKVLGGKYVSNDEMIQAMLGFSMIYGFTLKTAFKGFEKASLELDTKQMIKDVEVIKNTITKNREAVSLTSVEEIAINQGEECVTAFACAPQRRWVIERVKKPGSSASYGRLGSLPRSTLGQIVTTGLERSEVALIRDVISNGGYIISTNFLETFFKDYQASLLQLFSSEGRVLNKNWEPFFNGLYNGWALVAPSKFVKNYTRKSIGGFAQGRVLVVSEDAGGSYSSIGIDGFTYILGHEGEHVLAGHNAESFSGKNSFKFFSYNQDLNTKLGLFLSRGFEYGTDLTFEKVYGVKLNWGYKNQFIEKYNYDIKGLWERFKFESDGRLKDIDLVEFSSTGDDERFLGRLIDTIGKEKVRQILSSDRRIDKLTLAMHNWHKRIGTPSRYPNNDKTYNPNRMPWWIPLTVGAGTFSLTMLFAKAAGAEEIPPNTIIEFDDGPDPELDYILDDQESSVIITQSCDHAQPGEDCQIGVIVTENGEVADQSGYTTTLAVEPVQGGINSCDLKDQAFDCDEGKKCISQEYDSGDPTLKCYNDFYLDENSCSKEVKINQGGDFDGLHYHCDQIQSFKLPKIINYAFAQNTPSANESTSDIDQFKPLEGGLNCEGSCTVKLPTDLSPGTYKLVAYLTKKDSDQILDTDSSALTISTTQQPLPTDEEAIEDSLWEGPGCQENNSVWGIWNKQGQLIEIKSGFGKITGECNNTAQDLQPQEDQSEQSQSTNVSPVDSADGKCEDIYYPDSRINEDTNPTGCIHKNSKTPYPDCEYDFDPAEAQYCGL